MAAPTRTPQAPEWLALAVEAAGRVVEFWGFKRNQGRVWAWLYLEARAMSAQEIGDRLALSKAAVSILVRELEQWGVVVRVRRADGVWRYDAESDLWRMVLRVLQQRELQVIEAVLGDLRRARADAERDRRVSAITLKRIDLMIKFGVVCQKVLEAFLKTSRLDIRPLLGILASKL
ncbi:MAG TPA: MarR family transcriptional regulator [Myxococcota bacterium]|jgi:DNA-binding transcriptional regulator GbsR (MarR family)|nr:MarR family transcriptional regulator [Myxococcota bacterium]